MNDETSVLFAERRAATSVGEEFRHGKPEARAAL